MIRARLHLPLLLTSYGSTRLSPPLPPPDTTPFPHAPTSAMLPPGCLQFSFGVLGLRKHLRSHVTSCCFIDPGSLNYFPVVSRCWEEAAKEGKACTLRGSRPSWTEKVWKNRRLLVILWPQQECRDQTGSRSYSSVTHFLQRDSTSLRFHNFPKWHQQLWTECSNTWAYKRLFTFKTAHMF